MTARRVRFDIRQASRPLLILLGLWLVLCTAAWLLLVRPRVREYRSLVTGSGPQFEALQEGRAIVESKEDFLEALLQAQSDLRTLHDDILSDRETRMVQVHDEVIRLCEQFSVPWEMVTFGNEVLAEEGLDRHVMTVPLEGGYSNLRRFLQAVEDSDKFLLVEKVALAEGREGGVMLQLTVTLTTYFDLPDELRRVRPRSRRARGRA